jgi:hypothetical protein
VISDAGLALSSLLLTRDTNTARRDSSVSISASLLPLSAIHSFRSFVYERDADASYEAARAR